MSRIDEIKERETKAQEGPWYHNREEDGDCCIWGRMFAPKGFKHIRKDECPTWRTNRLASYNCDDPFKLFLIYRIAIANVGYSFLTPVMVAFDFELEDARFIAHSRADIPYLLALVEEAKRIIIKYHELDLDMDYSNTPDAEAWLDKVEK